MKVKDRRDQDRHTRLERKIKEATTSPWQQYPALRWTTYAVASVGVIWVSRYVFKAVGGTASAFKTMIRDFRS